MRESMDVTETSCSVVKRADGTVLVRTDGAYTKTPRPDAAWEIQAVYAGGAYLLGIRHDDTDLWFAEAIAPEVGSRSISDAEGPRYVRADGTTVVPTLRERPGAT